MSLFARVGWALRVWATGCQNSLASMIHEGRASCLDHDSTGITVSSFQLEGRLGASYSRGNLSAPLHKQQQLAILLPISQHAHRHACKEHIYQNTAQCQCAKNTPSLSRMFLTSFIRWGLRTWLIVLSNACNLEALAVAPLTIGAFDTSLT